MKNLNQRLFQWMPFRQNLGLSKALISIGLICAPAAWAVVDAPVREAMVAMQTSQAQKAFDLLSPLEISRAGDPDFDLVLGISANQIGQFARAIFALERVLAAQPEQTRARAELATALFGVGDTANARKLLKETKSEGIPEGVNLMIDEFLHAIDKIEETGRSTFRLRLDAGLGFDDNVNSGPTQSSFAVPALGGLVVSLLPSGIKTPSAFAHAGVGFSGRAVLAPRWSLIGNAQMNHRRHESDARAFDVTQVDANAGFGYRDQRHEFTGVFNFAQTAIGGDTLRKLNGLTGEWNLRPDGRRQWATYLQLAKLDYPNQPNRAANRAVLGTSYSQQIRNNFIYYAGAYGGTENARDALLPHLSHKLFGLRTGLQMPLNKQLSVYASASLEARRHGGNEPLFLTTRSDTQLDLSFGASWALTDRLSLRPQIHFNQTRSNIVINDSKKTSFVVMSRYEF